MNRMATQNVEETRDRYGKTLARLARGDQRVIAMDCDLGRSTRSYGLAEVDPRRFIEMGIAEQDMISTAAGLASCGKIVFVNSFAVFLTGRAFDQVRQQVSLPGMNVKLCGSSAGITLGPDGATHQSINDVTLMRCLPNMTVLVPADGNQTEKAVVAAYERAGPVYIRLSRYQLPNFLPEDCPFEVGKAIELRVGFRVALIATGPVTAHALEAASLLEARGVSTGVYDFHTIKPFDAECAGAIAARYEALFTIEEHNVIGGLGSAMTETLCELPEPLAKPPLWRLGVRDSYGESGTAEELLSKHGLDAEGIARSVAETLGRLGRKTR
jgi:transketolase